METVHPHVWAAEALQVLRAEQRVTPLRRLSLPGCDGVEVLLKDESALPTGSLKYRLVLAMFAHAVASGRITDGTHVVVGTGGAVAVAGARVAGLLGLPFTAVVPAKADTGVLDRIAREGGRWQVGEQPPAAVQQEAAALAARWGGHLLDHFSTAEQAVAAGGATIADELFEQVDTAPLWIVVGVGTGATSAALGRHLRRAGLPTRLAAVDPENSAYFPAWVTGAADYGTGMPSRIPGIGRPRVEPGFQPALLDLVIPVPDAASVAGAWWLRDRGIDAGPATGANLWGCGSWRNGCGGRARKGRS
jgi:cysteine synthase